MPSYGYARVFSSDQDLALQRAVLKAAGCGVIPAETASGTRRDMQTELQALLDFVQPGDTLVVTRVDCLALYRQRSQNADTLLGACPPAVPHRPWDGAGGTRRPSAPIEGARRPLVRLRYQPCRRRHVGVGLRFPRQPRRTRQGVGGLNALRGADSRRLAAGGDEVSFVDPRVRRLPARKGVGHDLALGRPGLRHARVVRKGSANSDDAKQGCGSKEKVTR